MTNAMQKCPKMVALLCRLAMLAAAVCTFTLVATAQSLATNDVKAVLFCKRDGHECFLSDAQVKQFVEIIQSMKPENKGVEGKALSQDFLFYYWNYSRQEKNLVKHSISFNTNGGSIYWRMTENESGKIRGLIRNLAEVAK